MGYPVTTKVLFGLRLLTVQTSLHTADLDFRGGVHTEMTLKGTSAFWPTEVFWRGRKCVFFSYNSQNQVLWAVQQWEPFGVTPKTKFCELCKNWTSKFVWNWERGPSKSISPLPPVWLLWISRCKTDYLEKDNCIKQRSCPQDSKEKCQEQMPPNPRNIPKESFKVFFSKTPSWKG